MHIEGMYVTYKPQYLTNIPQICAKIYHIVVIMLAISFNLAITDAIIPVNHPILHLLQYITYLLVQITCLQVHTAGPLF